MGKDLLIGLDLGTSAIKGVLVSVDGELIAQDKIRTVLDRPEPGLVEFSPRDHYADICGLIKKLVSAEPADGKVKAVSMAVASGNTLLADEKGCPLTQVISWMDTRAQESISELLPDLDTERVHAIVGWPFSGLFPLAHFAWFRKNMSEEYEKTAHYCMNSDYILYKLTGRWGMDPSTATTFYLQDQVKMDWHIPYLEILGISEQNLSPLMPSGTVLGTVAEQARKDTGLTPDTKIVLGAFDHPSAARGTGNFEQGDLLLSCGTSWVGFYPVTDRDLALSQNMLIDPFLHPNGPWGALFALSRIGVVIDKYIDTFIAEEGSEDKYGLLNSLAQKASPGANGLILDLGIDSEQHSGIGEKHSKADISRAIMESAAFMMKERIEELGNAGITAERITMVGGPAESPVWPQIVADVTGLELKLVNGQTAGALGAAVLAGIGAGIFTDELDGYNALKQKTRSVASDKNAHEQYDNIFNHMR